MNTSVTNSMNGSVNVPGVRSAAELAALGVTVHNEGNVAIIVFDQPDSPVNVLSSALGAAMAALFDMIERAAEYDGAVLMSGKRDTWIA